ncbi:hypothetical protein ATZ36_00460 [Candidatus Endomicrobiellum trichonymphae]|uniref:Uncharacterized protein n=1 Tax=Endomicrobium trichonymphae TaxID=1408204 RepID=A0A1E5IK66_ENDTX|nr:hypothetical protein ATZ36_00460 [Candidatus Endomicrobium trichonymphae]
MRSELANLSSATLRNTTLDIGNTAETNKRTFRFLIPELTGRTKRMLISIMSKRLKTLLIVLTEILSKLKTRIAGFSKISVTCQARIQSQQDVPAFYSNKIVVLEKCKED